MGPEVQLNVLVHPEINEVSRARVRGACNDPPLAKQRLKCQEGIIEKTLESNPDLGYGIHERKKNPGRAAVLVSSSCLSRMGRYTGNWQLIWDSQLFVWQMNEWDIKKGGWSMVEKSIFVSILSE